MTGPTRRERLKPLELVAMAAVLGVFTGGIAMAGTRQLDLAAIFAGIAFIVALLVLAMLALASGDQQGDAAGRPVLDRHDGTAPDAQADEPPAPSAEPEAPPAGPPAERP